MELREALLQINAIHAQVNKAETFRGYRAATVAMSGVVACVAAVWQNATLADPANNMADYLRLWISVAVVNVVMVGVELGLHCLRSPSQFATRQTRQAIDQFSPCILAGALMTAGLMIGSPESAPLLPGLWAVLFGLGVFASRKQVPAAATVGVYYLVAGVVCLCLSRHGASLSPWAMAATFGGGQLLTAAILFWTLERTREQE